MPRRNSGPRLWLRPGEVAKDGGTERLAQWHIKDDGNVRRPVGCFARDVRGLKGAAKAEAVAYNEAEEAKAAQALAGYITAKHTPSVQKGRGAGEVAVVDVLLMWGERVVQKRVEDLRAEDAKAGIVHAKPPIYEGRATRCMARLLQLGEFWQGKTLADVDGDSCDEYVDWRCGHAWKSARPKETGNAARTVTPQGARRELEDMRAAVNWHRGRGYCREVVEVALPAKGKPKEYHLDRPDAARLLLGMWRKRAVMTVRKDSPTRAGEVVSSRKRPHRHLCRFVLLGIYTGTRAGAIATASFEKLPGRSWLDLETGTFHRLAVGQAATNKRQPPVRIPDRLIAHIRRWKRLGVSKDYVVEFNGEPVEKVNKGFAVALADAGLKGSPHMLRHTCATWLLQRGVKSWDAANFLGMSEKVLLEVYGHWAADYQVGIAGGRKKRSLPPPELHDAFSVHYHRDKDLRIAAANRDARLKRLGLPHRSLATLAKAA
ncbi:site-specific integrase [Methylobacterium sp. J-078]|uniref:site-specific integrase n=1 Tax=Methylobacterium sp. J-078 TaxID=2836657 RepID=UPI001FB91517|nr:site-specific integrase [Methylobacterium sp. J-078]MCJ2044728.1 site-specific integrase [Methylobacterium sp. J-078]